MLFLYIISNIIVRYFISVILISYLNYYNDRQGKRATSCALQRVFSVVISRSVLNNNCFLTLLSFSALYESWQTVLNVLFMVGNV